MKEPIDLSSYRAMVITVNWNGRDVITGMIDSLLPELRDTGLKLLVVDNASTDGSDRLVEERYGSSGLVELRRMDRNLGYGQAANKIILESSCDFAVLMNTDIVLKPGSLGKLLSALVHRPDVAMAGPRLLWPDGTLQASQRDFIFPGKLILEHLPFVRKTTSRYSDHRTGTCVDWLVGAVNAIRIEPFRKLGGYSAEFSFFHEETDLMFRFKEAGWKIWFEPSSEMVHLESFSSRKLYGDRIDLRSIPGKLLFLRRHGYVFSIHFYRIFKSVLLTCRYAECLLRGKTGDNACSESYFKDAMKTLWRSPERGDD